ncbi:MAG TPA: ATP-binding protein [Bacteroidales bacterium]|nr:ATP-binding protein [Bacteroidales bacterium]HOQ96695.1 ATP-binding protein [Bacteroidales bacterium]HOT54694.1 ATP-binding protein [Bacteroidales bacterium]HPL85339.1 ATP-binding protein [Bacteroidales bacterium]HQF05958.1 ATP-binding protein [Bacteroidales bacterium]
MVGFASLLHQQNLDTETRNPYIDIIESSSRQLLNLVNDIIDISRIEAGELKINKTPFELHKILKETETLFGKLKHARGKQNLKIKLDIPERDQVLYIVTDPDRLKQILINLIGNALKFTEKGGIDFGYRIEDDRLKFYVSDNGIGMTEDDLRLVFERFKRSEQAHRKYEGTGLGLAITKELLDLLGGSISVESQLGRGSVFTFRIPYVPAKSQEATHNNEQTTDLERLRGKKSLIAEDEKVNRMYLEIILKELPIDIYWAKTANALSSDREKYLESGFVDHISKPIDRLQLIRIMERWAL